MSTGYEKSNQLPKYICKKHISEQSFILSRCYFKKYIEKSLEICSIFCKAYGYENLKRI